MYVTAGIGAWALAALILSAARTTVAQAVRTEIPQSIRDEHRKLHEELEKAMNRKDAIGGAARELGRVLHPHFVREEQLALPPLGALRALARGESVADAAALLAMADSLQRELPRMLREHEAIASAIDKLRAIAAAAGSVEHVRFANDLRLHARTEEEILYPAALVVGRLLRLSGAR